MQNATSSKMDSSFWTTLHLFIQTSRSADNNWQYGPDFVVVKFRRAGDQAIGCV